MAEGNSPDEEEEEYFYAEPFYARPMPHGPFVFRPTIDDGFDEELRAMNPNRLAMRRGRNIDSPGDPESLTTHTGVSDGEDDAGRDDRDPGEDDGNVDSGQAQAGSYDPSQAASDDPGQAQAASDDLGEAANEDPDELGASPSRLVPPALCRQTSESTTSRVENIRLVGSVDEGSLVSTQSLKVKRKGGGMSIVSMSAYSADVLADPTPADYVRPEIVEHSNSSPERLEVVEHSNSSPERPNVVEPSNEPADDVGATGGASQQMPEHEYIGRTFIEWYCSPRGRIVHHERSGNIYFLEEAGDGVCVKVLAKDARLNLSFHICSDRNAHVTIAVTERSLIASIPGTLMRYGLRGKKKGERASEDFVHIATSNSYVYGLCRDGQVCIHDLSTLDFWRKFTPVAAQSAASMTPARIATCRVSGNVAILYIGKRDTLLRMHIYDSNFDSNWSYIGTIQLELNEPYSEKPTCIFMSGCELLLHDGRHIYLMDLCTSSASRVAVDGILDLQNQNTSDRGRVIVLTRVCVHQLIINPLTSTHLLPPERNNLLAVKESDVTTRQWSLTPLDLGDSMIVNWRNCIAAIAVSKTSGDLLTMSKSGKVTVYGRQSDRPLGRFDFHLPELQNRDAPLRLVTSDDGSSIIIGIGFDILVYHARFSLRASRRLQELILDVASQESDIYILTETYIKVFEVREGTLVEKCHFETDSVSVARFAIFQNIIYRTDRENRSVQRLDMDSDRPTFNVFVNNLLGPETIMIDSSGYIIVGDHNDEESRVAVFSSSGDVYAVIPLCNSPILDLIVINGGELFVHLRRGFYFSRPGESQEEIGDDAWSNASSDNSNFMLPSP